MATSTYATLGGKPLLHPGVLQESAQRLRTPRDFWQRANSFRCPLGPNPGVAWVLMRRRDFDTLDKNAFHKLKFTEGARSVTIKKLGIVKRSTMNLALAADKDAAVLVRLEDCRRQLRMSSVHKQYNVRRPAPNTTSGTGLYYTDSLNGGSLWTWETSQSDLWGQLPTCAGSAPQLPYSPDGNPEGFRFIGVTAWDALHAVLGKIDVAVKYDPIADAFSYVRLGTTQSGLSGAFVGLADRLMYDYDPADDLQLANMPATVRVFFWRREQYHGIEKDTPDASNWEMSPAVSKDYSTGITGASAGTQLVLWDDLPALYDLAGTNTNSAALQTRADEIGANVVNRIDTSEERLRRIYCGVVSTILPGSEISEVIWRDYGDETGLVTEFLRRPLQELDQIHQSPPIPTFSSTNEHLMPPDLSRNTHPLWPRVAQTVQVDDGSSSTGTTLTANAGGLFPGFVHRWAAGSYGQLEACWIRPADLDNVASPSESTVIGLRQKDRFPGRLSGCDTVAGDTRPTYLVRSGSNTTSGDTICLVEITDSDGSFPATDAYELVNQNSTDCVYRGRLIDHSNEDVADLCNRQNVVDGADVWLKVTWTPFATTNTQDLIGRRVLARKVKDSKTIGINDFPFYEAAAEDSRLWGIVATGSNWLGTKNAQVWSPDHVKQLTVVGDATIADAADLWDNVISGSKGHALKIGDEFHPIEMERRSQWIEFTTTESFGATEVSITVTSDASIDDPPNTGYPGVTSVQNTHRFAGHNGVQGKARWNKTLGAYEINQLERSEPMMVEIDGVDLGGRSPELDGATSLAVWDARLVTPNETAGSLDGTFNAINEFDVWIGLFSANGAERPYYLTAGKKFLSYDGGQDFTPTGGAARRLYIAEQDYETFYGEAYENWTDASPPNPPFVRVRPIDDLAGSNRVDTFSQTVFLPRHAERDPNVVSGDRIAFRLGMDGTWVCVSDYLDDKIGTVKFWSLASGAVPPGWAVMNGTDNVPGSGLNLVSGAPGGGGFFLRGSTTAGQSGGTHEHTHQLTVRVDVATFVSALIATIEISDHTSSELDHGHDLKAQSAKGEDTASGTTFVPVFSPCTVGFPHAGHSEGVTDGPPQTVITDCPGSVWGPLTHRFEVLQTGTPEAYSQAYADSEIEKANHLPPYKTLIPIERIDNST